MRRISWRPVFFTLNVIGLVLLFWRMGSFSSQKLMVIRAVPDPDGVCRPEEVSEVTVEFGGLLDPATVKADAIRLLPYVPGTVNLEGERLLRLQLSKKLASATRYQVDLSPQLRGRGGEKPQMTRFYFLTPALTVKEVSQAKIEADRSSLLSIQFSAAVNPQAIVNYLSLANPRGEAVSFTPVGGTPNPEVQIRIPQTEWEELKLTIKRGLMATDGPLPLRDDYQAMVKVAANLQFLGMKVEERVDAGGSAFNAVKVQMNSPVDTVSADRFITIEPAVKHTVEPAGDGLEIWGEFKPAHRYVVTLKMGLSAGAAGAMLQDITRAVWFPDATPSVKFPYGDGVLSTQGLRTVPIRTVNVKTTKLAIYRLYANNLVEYALLNGGERFGDFGTLVNRTVICPDYQKNQDVETLLRLEELVKGDVVGIYSLQIRNEDNRWDRDTAMMVVSDLGLSARRAADQVLVWVTSFVTGRPMANCAVTLYSDRRQNLGMAMTDADGVARIAIPPLPKKEKPALVVAAVGGDLNYLSISENARDRGPETAEGRAYLKRGYEVFSFAERGVYRPGDTVRLSGLVRDGELMRPQPIPLNMVVKGPQGREFLRKIVMSDAGGRLLADLPIGYSSPSGQYQVFWHLPGRKATLGSADFQVADYIPQTLRMTVSAPEGRLAAGQEVDLRVHVEHLFGGPAQDLVTKCAYRYRTAEFQPKGWDAFKFGDDRQKYTVGTLAALPESKLDKQGNTGFSLKPSEITSPAAMSLEAQVEVLEPGGRAMTEYLTRTLDPWAFYLGAKVPDSGVPAESAYKIKVAAILPDGQTNPQAKGFSAKLYRVTYSNVLRKQSGRLVYDWTRNEALESTPAGQFNQGQGEVEVKPHFPGQYRLIVEGGENEKACPVTLDFEATGLGAGWVSEDPEKVLLTFDKPTYRPGDTARVHVRAPFGGTALMTVEAGQVLEVRLVKLDKGDGYESFLVKEEWRPNAYVAATVVRPVRPEKDWRPHRASGVARLKVDCADRRLEMAVETAGQVRPGQKMEVAVRVSSVGQVQPGATVMLAAVDEGVLALTRYPTPSPWDFFYPIRRLDIQEFDIYSRLAPELEAWKVVKKLSPGGGGGADETLGDIGRQLNPIQARRVKTAVLYAGNLVADGQGVARATFTVPEYIGELRIMAVAAAENRFGSVQKALKVSSPIMTQSSWPRFCAPGDMFQVPVTVFNRTAKDQAIKIEMTAKGPLKSVSPFPVTVQVAAGAEKLLRFSMQATGVGVVNAQFISQAGEERFIETVEISSRPAAGFDRKSGIVTIEAGKPQQVNLAGQYLPGTDKASVVIAGNRMVELSEILRYLLDYPYGCAEQTTSRMVPLIYLEDLARLADPQALGKEEIEALLSGGFLRLQMMQTYSGGLTMWPGQTEPYPWGSLYAADLLVEARKAGYKVPKKLIQPLLEYINTHIQEWATARQEYRPFRIGEAAYACYVLARAGEAPFAWMATLEETIRDCDVKKIAIPATARFHLAAACLAAGQAKAGKELMADPCASTVKREMDDTLDSPLREAAIKLLVLLDVEPESQHIPVLVETLRRGLCPASQYTTQEAAFALMALGKYARRTDSIGEGTVTITLPEGSTKAVNAREGWQPRDLNKIKPGQTIGINFQGKGKVYAFWNTEGVPVSGQVAEKDSGMAIRRTFFKIDGKTPADPNAFKAGDLYQVRLTIQSVNRLDNLVITDLLGAGLEIADLEMRGVGKFALPKGEFAMTINHVEPRDDRLLIFAQADQGLCEYRYLVRAVTAGEFVLPAVEASCMYDPGLYSVHGRGSVKVSP